MLMQLLMGLSLLVCQPAEEIKLLEIVPADADMVFSIKDFGELRKSWNQTSVNKFWNEPGLQALYKEFQSLFSEDFPEESKEILDKVMGAIDSISGDMVFFANINNIEEGDVYLGALIAPGEERDKFDELILGELKEIIKELEEKEDLAWNSDTYEDVDLDLLDLLEEDGQVGQAILGDTGEVVFLVASGKSEQCLEWAHSLIHALKGEADWDLFIESDRFLDVREKAAVERDFELYLDVNKYLSQIIEFEDLEEISFVGLKDLDRLYMAGGLNDELSFDMGAYLGVRGEGLIRKILDCFMGAPPKEFMRFMPSDSTQFYLTYANLDRIFKTAMETFRSLSEEEYNSFMAMYNMMVKGRLGIDPEKDILEQLNGAFGGGVVKVPQEEALIISEERDDIMTPGSVYILGVKDQEIFKTNFEKMLRALGVYVSMKKEEFQGNRIYSIQVPGTPMRIHWAYLGGAMAISPFPTAIRATVRSAMGDSAATMETHEKFQELMDAYPGLTGVSMASIPDMIDEMVEMFRGLLAEEVSPEIQKMLKNLPDRKIIDKHFSGCFGSIYGFNDQGVWMVLKSY